MIDHECCFNCYYVRADKILSGLEEGELPCEYYPPLLPINKDIMTAYVCEHYKPVEISNFKIAKRKRRNQSIVSYPAPGRLPTMEVVPIRSEEDLREFLKRFFNVK